MSYLTDVYRYVVSTLIPDQTISKTRADIQLLEMVVQDPRFLFFGLVMN